MNKKGNLFIRPFTGRSVTRKPIAVRMGKGKGNHSFWMCPIRAGQIIYELSGVSWHISKKSLKRASSKVPVKTKIVKLIY